MIQFLRGTRENLTTTNKVIGSCQPVFEMDTFRLKVGDGSTAYNDLPYIGGFSRYN